MKTLEESKWPACPTRLRCALEELKWNEKWAAVTAPDFGTHCWERDGGLSDSLYCSACGIYYLKCVSMEGYEVKVGGRKYGAEPPFKCSQRVMQEALK